jgi:hypothetical protein
MERRGPRSQTRVGCTVFGQNARNMIRAMITAFLLLAILILICFGTDQDQDQDREQEKASTLAPGACRRRVLRGCRSDDMRN